MSTKVRFGLHIHHGLVMESSTSQLLNKGVSHYWGTSQDLLANQLGILRSLLVHMFTLEPVCGKRTELTSVKQTHVGVKPSPESQR